MMELKTATDRIELTADEALELLFGSGRVRGDEIEVALPEQERLPLFQKLQEIQND